MQLRPATPADISVLRAWDGKAHVIAPSRRAFGEDDCFIYRIAKKARKSVV